MQVQIEDCAVPDLCKHGVPIVGEALGSPFFEPYVEEASWSVQELLASRPLARSKILDLFRRIIDQAPLHVLEEISKKTMS